MASSSYSDSFLSVASSHFSQPLYYHSVPSIIVDGEEYPWEPESDVGYTSYQDLITFRKTVEGIPDFVIVPDVKRQFEYTSLCLKFANPDLDSKYIARMNFHFFENQGGQRKISDAAFTIKDAFKSTLRREFETHAKRSLNTRDALRRLKATENLPADIRKLRHTDLSVGGAISVQRAGFNGVHFLWDQRVAVGYTLSMDTCMAKQPYITNKRGELRDVSYRYEGEWEVSCVMAMDDELKTDQVRDVIESSLDHVAKYIKINAPVPLKEHEFSKVGFARNFVDSLPRRYPEPLRDIRPHHIAQRKSHVFEGERRPVNFIDRLQTAHNDLPTSEQTHEESIALCRS